MNAPTLMVEAELVEAPPHGDFVCWRPTGRFRATVDGLIIGRRDFEEYVARFHPAWADDYVAVSRISHHLVTHDSLVPWMGEP